MISFFQCLLVFCCLFGSLEYYTEYEIPNTQFVSIPESMWWALQTVVCLGYGDIVPCSIEGKIMGSIVAIIGAMLTTVPLLFLGRKYLRMYCKTFSLRLVHDAERDRKIVPKEIGNERKMPKLLLDHFQN